MCHACTNTTCTYYANLISLKVTGTEDENILDEQDATLMSTDVEIPKYI